MLIKEHKDTVKFKVGTDSTLGNQRKFRGLRIIRTSRSEVRSEDRKRATRVKRGWVLLICGWILSAVGALMMCISFQTITNTTTPVEVFVHSYNYPLTIGCFLAAFLLARKA